MKLGILISGRGSNLQAIIDAIASGELAASIAVVISNRADAAGLARAELAGVPTLVMPHKAYPDRAAYDRALAAALKARGVELVCLAGFMRLLGPAFIDEFPQAVVNIHPSLLPAFPGLDAQHAGLRARREDRRRDGPFRDRRARCRPDHLPGGGPGARWRHGRDAGRPDPRGRASAVSGRHSSSCRGRVAGSRAPHSICIRSGRVRSAHHGRPRPIRIGFRRGCGSDQEHHSAEPDDRVGSLDPEQVPLRIADRQPH